MISATKKQRLGPQPPSVVEKTRIETTSRGIRFRVHDVQQGHPLPTESASQAFAKLVESPLGITCFDDELSATKFVATSGGKSNKQPLIMSAYRAYAGHLPLVISPGAVWLTIAQGFGHHINLDPDEYRE